MVTGGALAIIGLFVFSNRGFVARLFLDANVVGNKGWLQADAEKVGAVALISLAAFIIGLIVGIIGLKKIIYRKSSLCICKNYFKRGVM